MNAFYAFWIIFLEEFFRGKWPFKPSWPFKDLTNILLAATWECLFHKPLVSTRNSSTDYIVLLVFRCVCVCVCVCVLTHTHISVLCWERQELEYLTFSLIFKIAVHLFFFSCRSDNSLNFLVCMWIVCSFHFVLLFCVF
jgi:hypothetical protein